MGVSARTLGVLRNTGLSLFVAAILSGIMLPLYTDEVGWRLQERAGLDGVDKLYSQLCGPNTVARPPVWMMPVRYYSAFFNTLFPDPIFVRLSGIFYALAWTALLLLLISRLADRAADRMALSTLAFGFMSMGTMPLLLTWSRPEQPILLSFTGAMLIASIDWRSDVGDTQVITAWLRSFAIVGLALIAMSYHVKALFLVPAFVGCLHFASRGRQARVAKTLAAVIVVGAMAAAAHYWIHRLDCPSDAAARADFVGNNTGAALVRAADWSQISPLIGKALNNISLFQYLGMPAPRQTPMSAWLPAGRINFSGSFAWFLTMVFAWAVALLSAVERLAAASRHAWRDRNLEPRSVIALLLVAAALGWSATQGFRNDYEASFIVPLMVLVVICAMSVPGCSERSGERSKLIAGVVGLLGALSVPVIALLYAPSLAAASAKRGYLEEQPHSFSAFGYSGLRRQILAAAGKCGINATEHNRSLLIDDVTYFTFMRSSMPEHRQGLIDGVAKTPDPIGYLRRLQSDGVVVSCRGLTPELRSRARQEGQFCCLAPPTW